MVQNQVRVRINGGKTAPMNDGLFPHLRCRTKFCTAVKRSGQSAKTLLVMTNSRTRVFRACKRGDGPLPPIVTESGRQPDLVAWPPAER